jgi:type I restriction enzyme S subunit
MLPEGWHHSTLGNIARISSGGTPDRAEPSYWGGTIPWVTTGEIQFNTIADTAEKITEAGLKNSSAKLFPPGTLLMAMYGQGKTRGQVAKLGIEAATNQACAAILLKLEYNADFYLQYLSLQYERIREVGNPGTQKNLSGGLIKELAIPVPPKVEQERIAEILGTWHKSITTAERLLANSKKQKNALVARLLSPPQTWSCLTFDQVFVVANQKDAQVAATEYQNCGHIPIIDQGQARIAGYTSDDSISVEPPVIVFGDHTRVVKWIDHPFRPGADGTQLLRPAAGIHPKFAYHLLANTSIPNLGYSRHMRVLRRCCFHLPVDIESQARIADYIDAADKAISVTQQMIDTYIREKQSLMTQLLTGKRRVHLPEPEAENAG